METRPFLITLAGIDELVIISIFLRGRWPQGRHVSKSLPGLACIKMFTAGKQGTPPQHNNQDMGNFVAITLLTLGKLFAPCRHKVDEVMLRNKQ